jgi:cytochrome b561
MLGMFALGLWMVELDFYSSWYKDAPHYHKSFGLMLAAIIGLRIIWKLRQIKPMGMGKPWEQQAARIVHFLLYTGLLSMFLTGYLISTADGRGIDIFNWMTLPSMGEWFDNQEDLAGDIHEWLAYALMALVVIHVLAALKHHFIDKDATLIRMIKPLTKSKD